MVKKFSFNEGGDIDVGVGWYDLWLGGVVKKLSFNEGGDIDVGVGWYDL